MKKIDINQAVGMMVGLAVGDALGASLEFTDAREPANYLRFWRCVGSKVD